MVQCCLYSKFPDQFNQKIAQKLKRYGINVTKFISPRTKDTDLSDISYILFMHECLAHAESCKLKILADRYGKKMVGLSRKESYWNDHLKHIRG